MGSSDEMYERGVQDATHNDFNPFYYQHYFHYRQAYDSTRRRLRRTVPADSPARRPLMFALLLAGLLGLIVGGIYLFQPDLVGIGAARDPEPTLALAPTTALPTRPPPTVTPTPEPPTAEPEPVLRVGGAALVVNVGRATLRVRRNPGLNQPVQSSFAEGVQVTILEGPVQTDGLIWWRVEGPGSSGWSAERSPDGVVWLQPL